MKKNGRSASSQRGAPSYVVSVYARAYQTAARRIELLISCRDCKISHCDLTMDVW